MAPVEGLPIAGKGISASPAGRLSERRDEAIVVAVNRFGDFLADRIVAG